MRKLLPWLVVLASACGGAATDSTTTTAVVETTTADSTTEALVPATTTESAPSTTQADEGSGTVIPAGFIEYLQAIEPVVAFDPATTTMADFFAADSWGSTADGVHDRKLVNSRPRLGAECGRFGHDSLS